MLDNLDDCGCLDSPGKGLVIERELGMDHNFAEVSLLICPRCSRRWLRYFYEVEAFTGSGRWYLGVISEKQAVRIDVDNAKTILENLDWYYYGGSYFRGKVGKTRGRIPLNPV